MQASCMSMLFNIECMAEAHLSQMCQGLPCQANLREQSVAALFIKLGAFVHEVVEGILIPVVIIGQQSFIPFLQKQLEKSRLGASSTAAKLMPCSNVDG